MLRIDPDVVPTMAKTPTLGTWELDLLRTIERVVRLGHIQSRDARGEIVLRRRAGRRWRRTRSSCTARRRACSTRRWSRSGDPDTIRLQTIRAGFPCFCAALAGYVEATRDDDRRAQPAVPAQPLRQQRRPTGRGCRCAAPSRAATFGAEPDIAGVGQPAAR